MNLTVTQPVLPKRWGFWGTLGFSILIFVVHTLAQGISIGIVAGIESVGNPGVDIEARIDSVAGNGFYLAVATIVGAWVGGLFIVALILVRKNISVPDYLGLKAVPLKVIVLWLVIGLVFILCWEWMNVAFQQPQPTWMMETYQTAGSLPLLWIAIVIAAPLLEEMFFRGFMFEGFRDSWMGSTGAVLVTAIAWAAIHVQYELFQIVMIGLLGVLMGIAKVKTRSLYVPLALHVLLNGVAMTQVSRLMSSVTSG